MANERDGQGFVFPHVGDESYTLGQRYQTDPEGFLAEAGIAAENAACPAIAHEAFRRAEAFREAASTLDGTVADALVRERIQELASQHFGRDHEVAVIPYGLKFREKLPIVTAGLTGSGTGTITFLDSDADVDG